MFALGEADGSAEDIEKAEEASQAGARKGSGWAGLRSPGRRGAGKLVTGVDG